MPTPTPLTVSKPTPGRKSRILFNTQSPKLIQPGVQQMWEMGDISKGAPRDGTLEQHVHLVANVGYQLKHSDSALDQFWEADPDDPGSSLLVAGTLADGWGGTLMAKQASLTGITYVGGAPASCPMYEKRIGAGDSFASELTADRDSFKGPTFLQGTVGLSRIFVADADHKPNRPLTWLLYCPGSIMAAVGACAGLYFSGPASDHKVGGLGQFCLIVNMSGHAYLFERGSNPDFDEGEPESETNERLIWTQRADFQFEKPGSDCFWGLTIYSDCAESETGSWSGSLMTLVVRTFGDPKSFIPGSGGRNLSRELMIGAMGSLSSPFQEFSYQVPAANRRPITIVPLRADVRGDVAATWGVFQMHYATQGVLRSDRVALPFTPTASEPFTVSVRGDIPTGCLMSLKMYQQASDGTEVELTRTAQLSNKYGTTAVFTPTGNPGRYHHVEVTFDASSGRTETPTANALYIERDPVIALPNSGEPWEFPAAGTGSPHLPKRVVQGVSMAGMTENVGTEVAKVALADLTNEVGQTKVRSGIPVDIEILDDDDVLISRAWRGTIEKVQHELIPTKEPASGDPYPAAGAYKAELVVGSDWARVRASAVSSGMMSMTDFFAGQPIMATDAIKLLLHHCGYQYTDIPDLAVPFQATADARRYLITYFGEKLADLAQQIAKDWLGGFILLDPNAERPGSSAQRVLPRLYLPPRPDPVTGDYIPLLRFTRAKATGGKLRQFPGAFDTITQASGQETQVLPILAKATMAYEPPEANAVLVIGGGAQSPELSSGRFSQLAVNVRSFNALGLPDGHAKLPAADDPDNIGEIRLVTVVDPTIQSAAACNFITRRIYDAAAHAKETMAFSSWAPLIWDHADTLQVRARFPRVGDIVEVEDPATGLYRFWAIARCDVRWTKVHAMRADYQLVRTSAYANIARPHLPFELSSIGRMISRATMKLVGVDPLSATGYGQSRAVSNLRNEFVSLPDVGLPPIQDLDPSSSSFGEFYPMPGYDPAS